MFINDESKISSGESAESNAEASNKHSWGTLLYWSTPNAGSRRS